MFLEFTGVGFSGTVNEDLGFRVFWVRFLALNPALTPPLDFEVDWVKGFLEEYALRPFGPCSYM